MRSGQLRQQGTLQRRVEIDDPNGSGGKIVRHETVSTPWYADITGTPAARFALQGQKPVTESSRVIEMRFRNDVQPGWRFLTSKGVLLVALAFDPDIRAQRLVLVCDEEQPRG